jgi:hypothetical protein
MKTTFDHITVNYAEYSYFVKLSKQEKIAFMFEIYEAAEIREGGFDLSKLFGMIKESIDEYPEDTANDVGEYEYEINDVEKVDVIIDDENVMIESNSLVALRHIVYKFFESGYIMTRDTKTEKLFRKDKVTKYLRIFRIVDQVSSICIN